VTGSRIGSGTGTKKMLDKASIICFISCYCLF
jgi:hypothetical protein